MRASSMPSRSSRALGGGVLGGVLLSGVLLGAACNNPVYVEQNRPLEARSSGVDGDPFIDSDLFVVPVRQPTAAEAKRLVDEQRKLGLPMPVPWVAVRDIDIQIEWTLKNLENKAISARVTVNGGNEFGDYDKTLFADPAALPGEMMALPDLLGGGQFMSLAPGEVRRGIFREDQLRETALDLEVITRYPPADAGLNAPFIVLVRHSSASAVGLEAIPSGDVTPAMVRMSFLLEASGQAVLDYSVRLREKGEPRDKLAARDAADLYVPADAVLAPPVVPMAPPVP